MRCLAAAWIRTREEDHQTQVNLTRTRTLAPNEILQSIDAELVEMANKTRRRAGLFWAVMPGNER